MTSVSVALCTYNGEKHLKEQIESILSQTLSANEIIICDDCSTDTTRDILAQYVLQYPDLIKIYHNSENLGYVKNFEKALSLCTKDIIFLCDQDDIWMEDKIEKIIKDYLDKTETDIICHNVLLFGEAVSKKITYWELEGFNPEKYMTNKDLLQKLLFEGNVFPGMSMSVKKTFLEKHLPLKKINPQIIHDYELLLLALNNGTFKINHQVLSKYRIHKDQKIGFKRFSKKSDEDRQTRQKLYSVFRKAEYIKSIVEKLSLNTDLIEDYKTICIKKYQEYLSQTPVSKRFIERLNLKYRYKIFKFLS
ncbi:glycosyltransferase [Chryseobacterium echinoideorum]|uniref:glycosyltransferase n=1 Tax=Chryseobacterium echinoideorum TaxID=1549648 RepID=UPI00118503EB|nr:glycosyltransferase [Chryseobacterium echinoideorum]